MQCGANCRGPRDGIRHASMRKGGCQPRVMNEKMHTQSSPCSAGFLTLPACPGVSSRLLVLLIGNDVVELTRFDGHLTNPTLRMEVFDEQITKQA